MFFFGFSRYVEQLSLRRLSPSRPHHSLRAVSIFPLCTKIDWIFGLEHSHTASVLTTAERAEMKNREKAGTKWNAVPLVFWWLCNVINGRQVRSDTPHCPFAPAAKSERNMYCMVGTRLSVTLTPSKAAAVGTVNNNNSGGNGGGEQIVNKCEMTQTKCAVRVHHRLDIIFCCVWSAHTHTWNQIQTLYTLNWWRVEVYDTDTCVCQPS